MDGPLVTKYKNASSRHYQGLATGAYHTLRSHAKYSKPYRSYDYGVLWISTFPALRRTPVLIYSPERW